MSCLVLPAMRIQAIRRRAAFTASIPAIRRRAPFSVCAQANRRVAALGRIALLAACLVLPLAACKEEKRAEAPPPRPITAEAVGEFCGMALVEHPGPKGQIFVRSRQDPLWFATVRDAIAFTMLPEMPKDITAIWVSDMARAQDWTQPETWVQAKDAVFVIGSNRRSGMQTDEAVPFGDPDAARRFVAENGGHVVRLSDITPDEIFPGGESR